MTSMVLSQICRNFERLSEPMYSTGNTVTLRFTSDGDYAERGFLIVVSVVTGISAFHLINRIILNKSRKSCDPE